MAKYEKPDIFQQALWPFFSFMRYAMGCFVVYVVSMVILVAYAAYNHPENQTGWADGLIDYYVAVADTDDAAQRAGLLAHKVVFQKLGFRGFARSKDKPSEPTFWEQSKQSQAAPVNPLSKAEIFEVWQRGTYLFGVRLYHVLIALPAFALIALLGISDGLTQRKIRTACAGHESASLYHRAKHAAFTLAAPFAAAVYLASPYAYPPIYLVLPAMIATGVLLRLQFTFYKKYV
jgi:integrating conjugative element membrane protein (TIGR03747 family)